MKWKKSFAVLMTLMLIFTFSVSTVLAANVHLKGGKNAEPAFYDGGLTLNASGELAGLGYEDVYISITAMADVTSTCTNNGGNAAPGQNPAPITVMGGISIPKDEIKNGNTPFSVTTIAPNPIIPGAPDCPNPNWVESIDDLAFTSAVITVEQPAGSVVLTVSCTFSPATSDGAVSKQDVSCMSY
ncbi:MAG: hypothetical protein P8046_07070 [Anaerolineales bacterium]|jgi:hypothetical protein